MRKRMCVTLNVCLILAVVLTGTGSFAGDIKARMRARIPAIDALKVQGIIGEDNRGFLSFVGERRAEETVVAAENKDRDTIYRGIARQTETSADVVGNLRAIQIAQKGKSGHWFQDPDGRWYKK